MSTSEKFDLMEMKQYFEDQIKNARLISDISLSESNFKMLGVKLKEVFSLTNAAEAMENFMICYLVYWVYVLIYWDEEVGIHDELTEFCYELPQYQVRHHLKMLVDTLDNYNIRDFGYSRDQLDDYCSMVITRHAGIPYDEQTKVFEWIDDYRNKEDSVEIMLEDLYVNLPYKSYYIFSLLNQESRKNILWEVWTIMAEVSSRMYSKKELLDKYPNVSKRLIESCCFWYESRNFL